MYQPDRFGVPSNWFGAVPDDFYGLLGRVVMVAAVVENRLTTLLAAVNGGDTQKFAGLAARQSINELRREAAEFEDLVKSDTEQIPDSASTLFDVRNGLVHSLWPNPTLERAWGHRGVTVGRRTTEGSASVAIETSADDLRALIANFVRLYDQIVQVEQRVQNGLNRPPCRP